MELVNSLSAPDIDRLVECFQPEWREFYRSLDRQVKWHIRIYLNYRKSTRNDWTFMRATAVVVERTNDEAKKLYWEKIRYKQLTLFPM